MSTALIWTILTPIHELLVMYAVYTVLRRPREPRAMLAWILALIFLPVLGLVLYVLIGEPRLHRTRRRRRRRRIRFIQTMRRQAELRAGRSGRASHSENRAIDSFMKLVGRIGGLPPTAGNDVVVHHDSEKMFLELSLAIQSARSHVHMEYYIYQPDETGRAIRDLLVAKAREGVKCRLLLDFVGSWKLFPRFLRPLREAGVEVVFFMPVLPWRGRWRVNFRNHRKIVVIDGKIGFTGSQNIGDEYAGRHHVEWRDTHVRVTGPAVHHLQEIFIEDWYFASRRQIDQDLSAYFPLPSAEGGQLVQVVPSGPDRESNVLHLLLLGAIGAARESLSIATPYFVPDQAMIMSLQSAAYRGVRVRLLIPSQNDHKIVLWAGRTYYNEIIQSGIEVYEYSQAMLHSKVIVVDDVLALVGSANFDERSLRLNFEVSMVLYGPELAGSLYQDFETLLQEAKRISVRHHDGPIENIKLGLARLISPLL
ncbi:MAG TPA: cardiolipin synthase [Phycisphaerae bacterium]|nr:cardiolipin synthase [Phycisphaerae bacterium]HOJ74764.1 cardiolipin synthase [Phycisphaerae bacterium]HOM52133.1 cardiolipin synthase [Phycisphaerae bacterium]HON69292.1 cardiolipin synthase [Phycisphaerae bacterium]HOQ85897.1 cardiolipin synthase [Phycisphaerae bacterium]